MLDMNTQFGKMVITDDGTAFADDALKEEIQDNIEGERVPEIASISSIIPTSIKVEQENK